MIHNIVSISGGKDSTATAILALTLNVENVRFVFADTGHEHPLTYDYIDYLESHLDIKVRRVKADFSDRIEHRRQKIMNGELPGWDDAMIDRAADVLVPTGIPFLDLCLVKGRFPSPQARFCTQELKRNPIIEQIFLPLLENDDAVISWQGIRHDESAARARLTEVDDVGGGLFNYRPILRWSVDDVFDAHWEMNIDPNPLYRMGMSRVGCMPCINCNKNELRTISRLFPEEVARVREWEHLVSLASRRGSSTFFSTADDPTTAKGDTVHYTTHGIDRRIEWSKTSRGGRHIDWIAAMASVPPCTSVYGLCDG